MPSRKSNIIRLSCVTAFLLFSAIPVLADEENDWLSALKSTPADPSSKKIESISDISDSSEEAKNELATISDMNPTDLRSHASVHLKDGNIEQAIRLVEKAIELQPEDTDGRQIYADALEQKLKAQTQRDPHTFNQCIKQWYFLYKNSEYPEMGNLAAKHLKDLSGKSPYVCPTPKMYLTRVLMPEVSADGLATSALEEPTQIH